MNKREYLEMIHQLDKLPVPGTILYPPNGDMSKGYKLVRYEVDESEIEGVIECTEDLEIYWSLERIAMCVFKKDQEFIYGNKIKSK